MVDLLRNRIDWLTFKRRGPVNFMSPRALRCRLNKLVVSWLVKDEALRLLQARRQPKQYWLDLTADIEKRLIEEGIISGVDSP